MRGCMLSFLLASRGNPTFNFQRNCRTVFPRAVPFNIPLQSMRTYSTHILADTCHVQSKSAILTCVRGQLSGFYLYHPSDWQWPGPPPALIGHHILLWWSVPSNLCPFFIGFFLMEFWELFIYSRYKFLIRYLTGSYFLPVCGLSSHSFNSVSWTAEVLNFNEAPFKFLF